jgi:hypothetical protein
MTKAIAAVFTGLAALISLALPASATAKPGEASGSYASAAPTDTVVRVAGTNVFIHEVADLTYSGGVSGGAHDDDVFVFHADGTYEGQGQETCASCTIGGKTGSFLAVFNFKGSGDSFTGNLWFVSSGGGLSGLHGGGTFAGTLSGSGGTYSYQYKFAP